MSGFLVGCCSKAGKGGVPCVRLEVVTSGEELLRCPCVVLLVYSPGLSDFLEDFPVNYIILPYTIFNAQTE